MKSLRMKTRAFRANAAKGLLVTLALTLLVALAPERASAGKPEIYPPKSKPGGRSLAEWMESYWLWSYTGVPISGEEKGVVFLPMPSDAVPAGTGTAEDPAVFTGHAEIALPPGTPIVLPVVAWIGETYEDGSTDPALPDDWLRRGYIGAEVTLDGQPVFKRIQDYYVSTTYFDTPIPYAEPTDYGSVGAAFFQGVGFVSKPLRLGTHTLHNRAFFAVPDDNGVIGATYVVFDNTWTITVAKEPKVYPPDSRPHGKSYGEWSAAWWQWCFGQPADAHPLLGTADCSAGQSGKVWFLGGTFESTGTPITRECTIPKNTALFIPMLNSWADNSWCPEPTDFSLDELRQNAAFGQDLAQGLFCTVDGVPIGDLADAVKTRYRVQSPVFSYRLSPEHNFLAEYLGPLYGVDLGCITGGTVVDPVVADGVFVMLKPLSVGEHTLHFGGAIPDWGFAVDVTYHVTVVED